MSAMSMQCNTFERSTAACTSGNTARRSNFLGGKQVVAKKAIVPRAVAYAPLKVQAALTKDGKVETISKLRETAEKSMMVAAMTYQGMSVGEVRALRKALPASSQLVISKNTLMKRAMTGTSFEGMADNLTGPNCFIFADEDNYKMTVKACSDNMKVMKKKKNVELLWTAACMDGSLFSGADVKNLETLPTRLELIAQVAMLINQVPTNLAVAIKAAGAQSIFNAIDALKTKLEEEEKGGETA
mmetsp:Transcript_39975/g.67033  ORF Transcript_39975/g.67033 Transcript_39975/m.67033 type:complete len:243 (-) Transcript_39975:333-1061(-)|eukprot:CAMPEP_0198229996 /NCGR_PEP_ID=MMETSP1445-20131203/114412_1 /TAXON_ID=36898 /ORGANISM="Pyramimonas sp., Strain CCMP2087" /LENGTH=242 /DNA_ID=CAMNT_0043910487 /DNA_START=903 /DNA_END=1631 /DNA_ORIENTATION=+